MADLPLHARENLADAALENLVNQFARPLDFLRELVQNSIDAGSPRVEVWLCYRRGAEGDGVLEIHVDDFGEGMDEHIIDNHLTRLFSSTKEDDLTKIGKFGIGFTSIFAIQPDAILISAGFDAHYQDPLAGHSVTEEGYARMGAMLRDLAAHHSEGRIAAFLEGGYNLDALGRSVVALLEEWVD